ncbi:LexA family transcriptional regulator [Psychrobacter glaciei]|uniref:LexA family transcriptional regulator n=1 Tax=Psychrobacter glaciei TaxID=619771 RepID=UPI003F4771DD
MIDNFPERLKYFRSKQSLSQTDLSNLVGISQKQISDYEVGNSVPRQANLLKLINALNVTKQEFTTATIDTEGDVIPDLEFIKFHNEVSNLKISLPENIIQDLPFDKKNTIPTRVNGQSMLPLLNNGDIALIDTSQNQPQDGKVFAINFFNEELIARVFRNPDGTLLLSRDNDDYPPKTVSIDEVEIIGKLVYRMGMM